MNALNRREFLRVAGLAAAWRCVNAYGREHGVVVNDIHSQLNATRVNRIREPHSLDDLQSALKAAQRDRRPICIAGGRHAMGAQAFAKDSVMIDIRRLNRVLAFDRERGLLEVESGLQWPELLAELSAMQRGSKQFWTFAQKQTGADRLTIGGCVSANVHGRGLTLPPFVGDVEALKLINARGELLACSRSENPDLFRLVVGGYGLFGLVYSVTLRLVPRVRLKRVVEVREIDGIPTAFAERIRDGYRFGDFQYAIDPKSDGFLRRGVFSCYLPVAESKPLERAVGQRLDRIASPGACQQGRGI